MLSEASLALGGHCLARKARAPTCSHRALRCESTLDLRGAKAHACLAFQNGGVGRLRASAGRLKATERQESLGDTSILPSFYANTAGQLSDRAWPWTGRPLYSRGNFHVSRRHVSEISCTGSNAPALYLTRASSLPRWVSSAQQGLIVASPR